MEHLYPFGCAFEAGFVGNGHFLDEANQRAFRAHLAIFQRHSLQDVVFLDLGALLDAVGQNFSERVFHVLKRAFE